MIARTHNLPASIARSPHVRALALPVIPLRGGRFVVAGSHYGYEFRLAENGAPSACDCKAALNGRTCAHRLALLNYLEESGERNANQR